MQVRWTPPALRDLDQLQRYIAAESPSAAYRIARSIYNRTKTLLGEHPYAGRKGRIENTHELVLTDTNHIVVYRVGDDVEVVALMHAARDWPVSFS